MDACKGNHGQAKTSSWKHPPPRALYIHVPFCLRKCGYCDFYSIPHQPETADAFIRAVGTELDLRGRPLVSPLASVFVGGGTPTALGAESLRNLLAITRGLTDEKTEFSVEGNPATIDPAVAEVLADAQVNRVSIGAQSFRQDELALLGRLHSPDDIGRAVETVRRVGIENVGLDLIYGVPGQSAESWAASLDDALLLAPRHISCYALSFEAGTPLDADRIAGRVAPMDDSLQRDCYDAAIDRLASAGLEHYETSNFALPGHRCRHNETYWHNEPYLGLGPAAASYLDGIRGTNGADLGKYLFALQAGELPPADQEHLTGRAEMAETVMLALRLTEGLQRRAFRLRFGQDVVEAFPRTVERYAAQGVLTVTDTHVRLKKTFLFVANTVLTDFLAEV